VAKYMFIFRGAYRNFRTCRRRKCRPICASGMPGPVTLPRPGDIQAGNRSTESARRFGGSLVLEATSLDEATELAKDCPVFEFGGSVEVRPVIQHDL
jgi:hypothetical protein